MAEPLADQNLADKPIAEKPFADKSLSDKPFQDIKLKETIVESHESESGGKLAAVAADAPEPALESFILASKAGEVEIWKHYENHKSLSTTPVYRGSLRHRLIVGGCLCLAAGILALSTANLKALISTDGKIDEAGNIVIPEEPPKLSPDLMAQYGAREGMFKVKENTWTSHLLGFADQSGKIIIKPRFTEVDNFKDGLASFSGEKSSQKSKSDAKVELVPETSAQAEAREKKAQLRGYIDKTGKVVIPAQFDIAGDFDHGVALVGQDEHTLLINKVGEILFSSANTKVGAKASVAENDSQLPETSKLHRSASREVFNIDCSDMKYRFLGPFALISLKGSKQVGLIDRSGKWVAPPVYDEIVPARMDNSRGFSHFNSRNMSEVEIDATPFIVKKNNLFGVIDSNGKLLFAPKFEEIISFQNGHAAVLVEGKYGFADAAGNIVIKPQYDFATAYDKIIAVEKNKVWSFVDSTGKPISTPSVDGVLHSTRGVWFSDGMGAVLKHGKVGFLDSSGRFALVPQYDWALAFAKGRAPVHSGNAWHYIDKAGKRVTPDFAEANSLTEGNASVTVKGPLFNVVELSQMHETRSTISEWKNLKKSYERSSNVD